MIANFQKAMVFVALHEWGNRVDGGYTNDPQDPGGETKYGVSKRANPELDIKNLTLDQAFAVYKRKYWDVYGYDTVPMPLVVALFDATVNLGYNRAKQLRDQSSDDWQKMIQARKDFYGRLVAQKPTSEKYLKGWLNRCNDLWTYCHQLELESV